MTPEEKRQLKEVHAFMQNMGRYDKIPFQVDKALTRRIGRNIETQTFAVSSKGANTEDVTVNEAGASTYAVMNDPDGFLEVVINDVTYYVPYFT